MDNDFVTEEFAKEYIWEKLRQRETRESVE